MLPRRTGAYSPAWMDQLCAAGEVVWIGAGALGRSGRVALYFRDDVSLLGAASARGDGVERPDAPLHVALRERLARGAAFWTDLLVDVGAEISAAELQDALWDLVWAGEVTNDAFAPLRAPRLSVARQPGWIGPAAATSRRGRFSARGRSAAAQVQGRWSLTTPLLAQDARSGGAPACSGRAAARALRRAHARAGAGRGRPRRLQRDLLGADPARGARGRAARLLRRGPRRCAVRACRARSSGCASVTAAPSRRWCSSAVDPAQAYGAALPWPKREGAKSPARVAGAQVVLVGGEPVLYLERGGKGLQTLVRRRRRVGSSRRWRHWRSTCAPGAAPCASSRWRRSTASPRSPRRSVRHCSPTASKRARAGSR